MNRTYASLSGDSRVVVLRDSMSGVEESPNPSVASPKPGPTIVRGMLFLSAPTFTLHSSLFSLSGQKVLDLHPGQNDVSRLAPGVYFVGQASGVERAVSTVTKVIISR